MAKWSLSLPLLLSLVVSAKAETVEVLTLQRTIEIARDRAPAVRIARARVDEMRSAMVGASVRAAENPEVEALLGPRWNSSLTTDAEISLSVPIELGGKRGKRIAASEARIKSALLEVKDAQRQVIGSSLDAYYHALHAAEVLAIATRRKNLADSFVSAAIERQRAGEIAQFEVDLAESELLRAESGVAAAHRDLYRANTALANTLGLSSAKTLTIRGELSDYSHFTSHEKLVADSRSDIGVAKAQLAIANAELSLAQTERIPSVSFRVKYLHDEGSEAVLGGIAVDLPIFQRGQGVREEARARRARAELELNLKVASARSELDGAETVFHAAIETVRLLEKSALPRAETNAARAEESYRVGKIDLAALLLIRREALEVRRELVDQSLQAALAGAALWVAGGAGK